MTRCFYCGQPDRILLSKHLLGDLSEFHEKVIDMEPCTQCKEFMKQGIIILGIEEPKTEKVKPENAYRTGHFAVIRETALRRLLQPLEAKPGISLSLEQRVEIDKRNLNTQELLDTALKNRWIFMAKDAMEQLGFTAPEMLGTDGTEPEELEKQVAVMAKCSVCGNERKVLKNDWKDGKLQAICRHCFPDRSKVEGTFTEHVLCQK